MSNDIDIGTLVGAIELDDHLTSSMGLIEKGVEHINSLFESLADTLPAALPVGLFLGAAGAVAAITAEVVHLTSEGSKIVDLEDTFDHLNETIGNTPTEVLKKFSAGVKGTVDDLTLLKDANKILQGGVELSANEFNLLGKAARAMGKASGEDATTGLESLSAALLTGRTRGIAQRGILVDLKKSEEDYAKSIGVASDALTESEKKEAHRQGILQKTQEYVDRLGEQQLSFRERLAQGGVAIDNWWDKLEAGLARSPAINNALSSVMDLLGQIFGPSSESMIDSIIGTVNEFADAVHFGAMELSDLAGVFNDVRKDLPTINGYFGDLGTVLKSSVIAAITTLKVELLIVDGILKNMKGAWTGFFQNMAGVVSAASGIPGVGAIFTTMTESAKDAAPPLEEVAHGLDNVDANTRRAIEANERYAKTTDKVGEALKKIKENQANLVIQAQAWSRFVGSDESRVPEAIQKDYYKALQAVVDSYGSLKAAGLSSLDDQYTRLDRNIGKIHEASLETSKWATQILDLSKLPGYMDLSKGLSKPPTPGVSRLPFNMTPSLTFPGGKGFFDSVKPQETGASFGTQFMQGFNTTVLQTFIGGGSVWKAASSYASTTLGNHFAKDFPKAVTNVLPGVGALLGPAIGKLGEMLFNKFFGSAGRDAVKKFADSFGGFDDLHKKLQTLGADGEQMWVKLTQGVGRNNAKQAQQVIEQVTQAIKDQDDALNRYGLTLDDLKSPADRAAANIKQLGSDLALFSTRGANVDSITKKISGPLNDALRQALDTNTQLAPSFEPYLESLIRGGGLSDDLARKLLGLPAPNVVPWQQMEDIATEFGISVDNLGPKFQASKLNDNADDLGKKFKLLVDNGADVGAVIDKMGDKALDFLHNAEKWGIDLPASMKPLLEAMAKEGKLTDEFGNKLDTVDDIHFGEDLTDRVEDLVKAMKDLVDVLSHIPNPTIHPNIDWPQAPDWSTNSHDYNSDTNPAGPYPQAEGGMGHVNGPTMFYSAGNEDFAFSGEGKKFGGSGSGNQYSIVIKAMDSRDVADFMQDPRNAEAVTKGVVETAKNLGLTP